MSDEAPPSSSVTPAPLVRAPVIGRDGELALLKQIYDSVLARSEARVATVVGPAGIGKTRLAEQLVAELATSRKPRVYYGAARAQGLAYGLFDSLLRSAFDLAEGLSHEASVVKVRDQVASILDDRRVGDVCYFLGGLLGLSFADSPFTRAVMDDPTQARLIRRAVLRSFFEADARRMPLCLVLDDLQDADEDSLDLLSYLIAELKGPIVLLCLARPELLSRHERWLQGAGSRHDLIELAPVSSADARSIMHALLTPCEGGPPDRLLEAGLGMAGGNPGLLAHMVRIFHDSGVLRERGEGSDHLWQVDLDRLNHARLPLTVEDAVAARLAVLSAVERRLLEHAAAMGSVFWLGGLVALARMDREAPDLWNAKA
ncbi:MAG TPA: AAA family ATPase, partial [Polyangiaceae bacterium]|nr:AAA family ATPase [Polyangiaceae bacterium]